MKQQPLRALKKMIFPNERSQHAFQLTGNPWTTLALIVIAAIAIAWSTSSNGDSANPPDFLITGTGNVVYVIDGDTAVIRSSSGTDVQKLYGLAADSINRGRSGTDLHSLNERIKIEEQTFTARIGNINTAESVHPDATRNTRAGKTASEAAKRLIDQQAVNYQCYDIGYYGRPICSIQTGDFDFALEMIRLGYSEYVQKYGKHPLEHERYLEAAQQAQ